MASGHFHFLIELAHIDGEIQPEERDLLHRIGEANDITREEVDLMIEQPTSRWQPQKELTDDEKYTYIYHIVQLMKADGRLFKEEINYCAQVASQLGYEQAVLFELITKINKHEIDADNNQELKNAVQLYLK